MLPSFYQACLQSQLTPTQFVTLEILVELLQQERRITIERLATLFPQPILFESRRRNLLSNDSDIGGMTAINPALGKAIVERCLKMTPANLRLCKVFVSDHSCRDNYDRLEWQG